MTSEAIVVRGFKQPAWLKSSPIWRFNTFQNGTDLRGDQFVGQFKELSWHMTRLKICWDW